MISKTIRVSDKGQISIPSSIRDIIGIQKGDDLLLIENNGKIFIEKIDNISRKVVDDFSDLIKFKEKSLAEVWDNQEDEIWGEYLKNDI